MLNQAGKKLMAKLAANITCYMVFSGTRSIEEINRDIDALPTPPDWFRASVITDMRQLMRDYTDHTEEEIEAKQELELKRHRKSDYQRKLKQAGSPEKLKALQEEAHLQWKINNDAWRASNAHNPEWCARMGLPAPKKAAG